MPTVGPTLPPHLQKRKRSPSDPEESSPPRKIQAAIGPALPSNPDELDIDFSSDDGYGPSAQAPKGDASSPPRRTVGPSLPPAKNPDELDIRDESSEDDGPAPPPKAAPAPAKRVLGPAPPPANLSERPSHPVDSDSSDDDDYGPAPPPAPGSQAALILEQRAQVESARRDAAAPNEPAKPQRAEWMLAPPTDSDWSSRVDPTKLKNRKFASGKGSKAPAEKTGVSAIWTETPEEKRKRLEDEVLGRKEKGSSASAQPKSITEDREARETARRIREYNERNRGKSLMDEHAGQSGVKEKEDDPSKRGFDREKDMALGGRLGHGQKKEMLAKAADFGSRFQKGRYL
jgi:hypothetical protein